MQQLCYFHSTDIESNQSTTVSDFFPHNDAKRLLPNPDCVTKVSLANIDQDYRFDSFLSRFMVLEVNKKKLRRRHMRRLS